MTATRRITIDLPEDLALQMDAEVSAGAYASEADLVIFSLDAHFSASRYDGSDPVIERWLVEEVGPTYDAYKADPSRLLTEEEVFAGLQACRAVRSKQA